MLKGAMPTPPSRDLVVENESLRSRLAGYATCAQNWAQDRDCLTTEVDNLRQENNSLRARVAELERVLEWIGHYGLNGQVDGSVGYMFSLVRERARAALAREEKT